MADLTEERLAELRVLAGAAHTFPFRGDTLAALVAMADRALAAEAKLADAERVIAAATNVRDTYVDPRLCDWCGYAGGPEYRIDGHEEDCPWLAVTSALDTYTAKHGAPDAD